MATEVNFYHLTKSSLEDALPRLLLKTLQAGERAVVMLGSPERVDALNTHLWTYDPNGFLPHGTRARRRGRPPAGVADASRREPQRRRPSCSSPTARARKGRPTTSAASSCSTAATRGAVADSRERWKAYKAAGHAVVYWQQTAAAAGRRKPDCTRVGNI